MTDIVIVGAKRTPIGSFQGQFHPVNTNELGATAIRAAVEQAGIDVVGSFASSGGFDNKGDHLRSTIHSWLVPAYEDFLSSV